MFILTLFIILWALNLRPIKSNLAYITSFILLILGVALYWVGDVEGRPFQPNTPEILPLFHSTVLDGMLSFMSIITKQQFKVVYGSMILPHIPNCMNTINLEMHICHQSMHCPSLIRGQVVEAALSAVGHRLPIPWAHQPALTGNPEAFPDQTKM